MAEKVIAPDAELAALEVELRTASGERAKAIQERITARRAEVMKELGITNAGFGTDGYIIPAKGQVPDGTIVLSPTSTPGVFLADKVSSGSNESYGRVPTWGQDNKMVFYDASGRQLSAQEVAKTTVGRQFARAGWDVGAGLGTEVVPEEYKETIESQGAMPPGGGAYYDSNRNVIVVNDANGVSLYDTNGNLIYGKGSVNTIGMAGGGLPGQVDIAGTGYFEAEDYNPNAKVTKAGGSVVVGAGNKGTTGAGNVNVGGGNVGAGSVNLTAAQSEAKSAYTLLYEQFQRYGLGSLVEPLKNLIMEGVSPAEFTIRLRETDAYKKRFAANQKRISQGLRALSEAEYIALEDQYQDVMRRYGLPETYYSRGDMGTQAGFEKFIGLDVSPVELEDRIQTAYNRVINANPEVGIALRTFYPGITNGDILAYALDPQEALDKIKRKVTAAEIGGAAVQAGLTTNESDAEYLARYGITKEQAQAGYRTISGYLPRAQQLSSIYGKQVEGGPYTQATAEQEVFGVPGAAEAERKRQRITSLEQAAFAGQSGLTGGALGRERAGSI